MGFVFAIDLIAKRLALGVKDNGNVGIRMRFNQRADHIDDAFDRAGSLTAAVDQRRQGVKSPEKIGRPIYQNQFFRTRHRSVLLVSVNTGLEPVNQPLQQLVIGRRTPRHVAAQYIQRDTAGAVITHHRVHQSVGGLWLQ